MPLMTRRQPLVAYLLVGIALLSAFIGASAALAGPNQSPRGPLSPEDAEVIDRAHDDALLRERRSREKRLTPEAADARSRSRNALRGLGRAAARSAGLDAFPEFLRGRTSPLHGVAGDQVKQYLGSHTALVEDSAGRRSIALSEVPVLTRTGEPVDVGLREIASGFEPKAPLVPLQIPMNLSKGVIAAGTTVTHVGGASATGVVASGSVLYANSSTDTDFVVTPIPVGVEFSWLVRSPAAPEVFRLGFAVDAGRTLRMSTSGDLEVLDGSTVVQRLAAPTAVDAQGKTLKAEMTLVDGTVEVRMEHRDDDVAYPVLLDPPLVQNGEILNHWNGYNSFSAWLPYDTTTGSQYWVFSGSGADGNGLYLGAFAGRSYPAGSLSEFYWRLSANDRLRTMYLPQVDFNGVKADIQGDWFTDLGIYSIRDWTWQKFQSTSQSLNGATFSVVTTGERGDQAEFMFRSRGYSTGRHQYLNEAVLHFRDKEAPTVTAGGGGATDGWTKGGIRTRTVSATDPGIGIRLVGVRGPAAWNAPAATYAKTSTYTEKQTYHGCEGNPNASPCPTSWTADVVYDTSYLDSGIHTFNAYAEDILQYSPASAGWTVKVDKSSPNSSTFTGTVLASGGVSRGPSYSLNVGATDQHSGVRRFEVLLDNGSFANNTVTLGCSAPAGCATTAPDQTFSIPTAGLSYGQHPLKVSVWDALDNDPLVQTVNFTVLDKEAPTVTATGSLREPLPTDRTVNISAKDTDGTISKVEVWVDKSTSSNPKHTQTACPTTNSQSCDFAWSLPDDVAPGVHEITVRATDKALNASTDLKWNVAVADLRGGDRSRLGLEEWFDFDSTPAGADSEVLVNAETGNAVWHQAPLQVRGRGLSTVLNVTYNSLDRGGLLGKLLASADSVVPWAPAASGMGLRDDLAGHSYAEAGYGFSVGISGPTRINEPLDGVLAAQAVEENLPSLIAPLPLPTQPTINLTDADGTRHTFVKNGSTWTSPKGLNMRLRRYSGGGNLNTIVPRKWALTRPDGVTHFFDNFGYLRETADRNGNSLHYRYETYNALGTAVACNGASFTPNTSLPATDVIGRLSASNTKLCAVRLKSVEDPAFASDSQRKTTIEYRTVSEPSVLGALGVSLPASVTGLVGGTAGRIRSVTDMSGRKVVFAYGGEAGETAPTGFLAKITEAAGTSDERITEFMYESQNSLLGTGAGDNDRQLKWIYEWRKAQPTDTNLSRSSRVTTIDYPLPSALAPTVAGVSRRASKVTKRGGGTKDFGYVPAAGAVLRKFTVSERVHAAETTPAARPVKTIDSEHRLDSQGRLKELLRPDGGTLQVSWDALRCETGYIDDNKVRRVVEAPTATAKVTEFVYHPVTGVLSERRQGIDDAAACPGSGLPAAERSTKYTYRFSPGTFQSAAVSDTDGTFVADLTDVTRPKAGTNWKLFPNAVGNVERIEDGRGYARTIAYATGGVVISETDEEGNVTTFSQHDATGQPGVVQRPKEDVVAGRPTPVDRTWRFAYDMLGRLTHEVAPGPGAPATIDTNDTTRRPYTTRHVYDNLDRVTSEVRPKDSKAVPATFVDEAWRYDRNGNLEQHTRPDLRQVTMSYNEDDQLALVEEPGTETATLPQRTRFVYDDAQRLIARMDPLGDGVTTTSAVAGDHRTTCESGTVTPRAYLTRYCLDGMGRRVAEVRYSPGESAVDDRAKITTFAYDARGNEIASIDPKRNRSRSVTQAISDVTNSVVARDRARTLQEYDRFDQLKKVTEQPLAGDSAGTPSVWNFGYDANGNRTSIVHPRSPSYVTALHYDHRDELVARVDPEGDVTCTTRRRDGKVIAITTPRGANGKLAACVAAPASGTLPVPVSAYYTTLMSYDKVGDLDSRTLPFAPNQYGKTDADLKKWKVTYDRNGLGQPETITDPRTPGFANTFFDSGELKRTDRPSWWSLDFGDANATPEGGDRYESGGSDADTSVATNGPRVAESPGAASSETSGGLPDGLGYGDFGEVRQQALPSYLPKAGQTTFTYDDAMRLRTATAGGVSREVEYHPSGAVRVKRWPFKSGDPVEHVFDYDANGNLKTSTDKGVQVNGSSTDLVTTFAYDGYDRLVQETTPGAAAAASDSAPGQEVAGTEVTKFQYDLNDFLLKRETPRSTTTTDANDFIFNYTPNTLDQLVKEANPTGETWSYAYDTAGNRTSEISPRGASAGTSVGLFTTTMRYDAADRLFEKEQSTNDAGSTAQLLTTLSYDDDGNLSTVDEPGAENATGSTPRRITSTVYDGRGLPWKTTRGVGDSRRTTVQEFDSNGNLRRVVDPRAVSSDDSYPAEGTDIIAATKNATVREYDADGLLTRVRMPWDDTDTRRFLQDYQRDGLGRIQTLLSPYATSESSAPRTSYTYNDADWITSVTDKKLTTVTSPQPVEDRAVTYDYDERGNQTLWDLHKSDSTTKERRVNRTFWPDGMLRTRTARVTDQASDTELRRYRYYYNPNRSLSFFFDDEQVMSRRKTEILRDAAERPRLVDELWPNGKDTQFVYDAGGNLATRKSEGDATRSALVAGQEQTVTSFSGAEAKVTTFDYDSLDREIRMEVDPAVGTNRITTKRWWGSDELRETVKGDGAGAAAADTVERWYWTSRGLAAKKERISGAATSRTTDTTDYDYDAADNRKKDERGTYTFNARDQVISWTRPATHPVASKRGSIVDYTLRGDGAITVQKEYAPPPNSSVTRGELKQQTDYDYLGDGERLRTATTRRYATVANQQAVVEKTTASYSHNALGAVTRILTDVGTSDAPALRTNPDHAPEICDTTTARLQVSETLYCYDEFERLKFSRGRDDSRVSTLVYDGLDRRDKKTWTNVDDSTASRDYAYLGTSETLARDVEGNRIRSFDYDSRGSRQGLQFTDSGVARYRPYTADANGSIVGLESATDGTIDPTTDSYLYDPYGRLEEKTYSTGEASTGNPVSTEENDAEAELSSDAQDNPFRFQGFYYDNEIQTYDMNARHYRADMGRFLSPDLFADAGGDLLLQSDPMTQNRYVFGGGNPVTRAELDGHRTPGESAGGSDAFVDAKGSVIPGASKKRDQLRATTRTTRKQNAKAGQQAKAEHDLFGNSQALGAPGLTSPIPAGVTPKPGYTGFSDAYKSAQKGVADLHTLRACVLPLPGDAGICTPERKAQARADLAYTLEGLTALGPEFQAPASIVRSGGSVAAKAGDDVAEVGADLAVRPKLKPSWHYLHERKMERSLRTADVLDAYKNPLAIGKTRYDEFGRPSILFQGRNAQVAVNPQTGEIVTAFKTGSRVRRQLLRRAGLEP
jgi:RHS repeat-associated protein